MALADIVIYTDGSCLGNPGPGGWACFIQYAGGLIQPQEAFGSEQMTTNNRMELMAAYEALSLVAVGEEVDIYTDSQYLQKGISSWLAGWKRNGWLTAQKTPVKNSTLWQALDILCSDRHVHFFWVKAHNQNASNDYVDRLARQAATEQLQRTVRITQG